ncbi:hypothetical protein HPB47_015165 [Ixodes persulcatus]|uniref:Uncharacterized protein n=1 Tax=Ixodes persulcatus TaxID=34615 RepID=A0AC60QUB4_IXOPE|nr:hypothetical protein HPB47_015165 [Ixodes persulcatus]
MSVVFRAQERYDLTSIPTSTLQRNLYTALNINQAQCTREELPTFRTSKVTNTISAIVRDRQQAQTLLKMRSLKASDKAVTVIAHEIPPEDTCRGVAHGVGPNETASELHEALQWTQEILYARPLGSRGLALVTFQGKRPPRTILYHGFITKVTLYKPTTVVCRRCQGLGHKEMVCTRKPRCTECGCIMQDGHVCQRKYCVNCRSLTHLATNNKCPARIRADKMLQQKTRKGRPSSKRAATTTEQRTEVKPPHVTIDEFPPLETRSSSLKINSPDRRSRSRSAAAGSTRKECVAKCVT